MRKNILVVICLVAGIGISVGIPIGILSLKDKSGYSLKITTYTNLSEEYNVLHTSKYRMSEENVYLVAVDSMRETTATGYIVRGDYFDLFMESFISHFPQCCVEYYYNTIVLYEDGEAQWIPPFRDIWYILWTCRIRNIPSNITFYEDVK